MSRRIRKPITPPARPRLRLAIEAMEPRTLMAASLISDLNPYTISPANITDVSGKAFFTESDGAGGQVLYSSDGTAAGTLLLRDFTASAPVTGSLSNLTAVGTTLYFAANDATGTELWKSDGTAAGTVQVKDINPGAGSSDPSDLRAAGTSLFFTADDGTTGVQLYKSDGTAAGTVLVPVTNTPSSAIPTGLTAVGTTLFFSDSDGTTGFQLYKTDGTAAGTVRLTDINPGPVGAVPVGITAVGSDIFFFASDGKTGYHLYTSDGTVAGTQQVGTQAYTTAPAEEAIVGSSLYYAFDNGAAGVELDKSDGTAAGTVLVATITPTSPAATQQVFGMTAAGSELFFGLAPATATSTDIAAFSGPAELYKSDGTAAGTTAVAAIRVFNPGGVLISQGLTPFVALGSKVYFADNDPTSGPELFSSDGTAAGTGIVKDLNPGPAGSGPIDLAVVGGSLYFGGHVAPDLADLFKSDGTAAGTTVVKGFATGQTAASNPVGGAILGNTLVFSADDGADGEAVWKTDGTAGGTAQVMAILPEGGAGTLSDFTPYNGAVYFSVAGSSAPSRDGLWKTDGTAAGTTLVQSFAGGVEGLTPAGGTLFLVVGSGLNFNQLWKTDGTAAGTVELKQFSSNIVITNQGVLAVLGSEVYFATQGIAEGDSPPSAALFKSDGTAAGTVQVNTTAFSISSLSGLTPAGNVLFFVADDGKTGSELYKTDGTAAGTVQVKDINPGPNASAPLYLTAVGTTVYFAADDGTHGSELWKSDGTAAGTVLVADVNTTAGATPAGSFPQNLTAFGSSLLFSAEDGTHGRELFISDGTPAGTSLVKDINPGAAGSLNTLSGSNVPFTVIGPDTFFPADDGTHGFEPWMTDGTAAGTVLVQDINPGFAASNPVVLGAIPAGLVLAADDGVHGREPYLATTPAFVPPTIAPVPDQAVNLGSTLTVPVTARTTPPGTTLLYTLGAGAPAGASIDQATGVLTFTPTLPGIYHIVVDATTQVGTPHLGATTTINVTVNDVAPIVSAGPNARAPRGVVFTRTGTVRAPGFQAYTATVDYGDGTGPRPLPLTASDVQQPGNFPLTYTFAVSHTYAAIGNYTVTVSATDGSAGGTSSGTFQVAVRPEVAGDYDGDGKTDLAIYNSQYGVYAYRPSSGGRDVIQVFGPAGGVGVPAPGDYNGDGKTDPAVYDTLDGTFSFPATTFTAVVTIPFGPANAGFVAVPGDYDGDGKTDLAIYNSQYGVFAYRPSSGGADVITVFGPGNSGFVPVPEDFDGDGKTDLAIYNSQYGVFAYRPSSGGADVITVFGPGNSGFVPVPEDFDGDGKTDLAIYSPEYGVLAYRPSAGGADVITQFGPGAAGFAIVPGDFDGDGRADFAIYNSLYAVYADRPSSGGADVIQVFGPPSSGFVAPQQSMNPTVTARVPAIVRSQSVPGGPAQASFAKAEDVTIKARQALTHRGRRAPLPQARSLPTQADVIRKA